MSRLSASGLLSEKIGGPSVFPPQPPGVWDLPYNDDQWEESKGPDKYRRGIYTFVRRSARYPAMVNFDAPSREYVRDPADANKHAPPGVDNVERRSVFRGGAGAGPTACGRGRGERSRSD